jgi:hypothetical protein
MGGQARQDGRRHIFIGRIRHARGPCSVRPQANCNGRDEQQQRGHDEGKPEMVRMQLHTLPLCPAARMLFVALRLRHRLQQFARLGNQQSQQIIERDDSDRRAPEPTTGTPRTPCARMRSSTVAVSSDSWAMTTGVRMTTSPTCRWRVSRAASSPVVCTPQQTTSVVHTSFSNMIAPPRQI